MKKSTAHSNGISRLKGLLSAAAILSSSAFFISPSTAYAQGAPISFGVSLGLGLLSHAARHLNSQNNAGASVKNSWNQSYSSEGSRNRNAAISQYNKAVKYFNSMNYTQASASLQSAIQIDPSMGSSYALLGSCQLQNDEFQQAMQNFVFAERFGVHRDDLCFDKGLCAAHLHDYALAEECFQQSYASNKRDSSGKTAHRALEIIQRNFFAQSNDDYLSEAGRDGMVRWSEEKPLRVYIQEDANLRGYHSEFAQIVRESFQDWSKGTNGKINFVFTSESSIAQIKVSWTDNLNDFGDNKELGVTHLSYSDGSIESADIKLFTLVGYCKDNSAELYPQAKCVALHEIGHALGLQHSSESFDTMFPMVPPKGLEFALTRRDLNTVTALYNKNTAITQENQTTKSLSEMVSEK
jgi:tetratricopeptide (TPR) repeat protein